MVEHAWVLMMSLHYVGGLICVRNLEMAILIAIRKAMCNEHDEDGTTNVKQDMLLAKLQPTSRASFIRIQIS